MRSWSAWVAALALVAVIALGWRVFVAWWYDDFGNIALARGDDARARALFEKGLGLAPESRLLREDRGRALLDEDPGAALRDFTDAACGAPCVAEAGDAQARLGNMDAAVADYLDAKAANRLAATADGMAAAGKFDEAIALETALSQRLGDDILLRADLAASQARVGKFAETAARANPARAAAYRARAIDAYARASALAPFNEGYLLSLGFAQMNWGDKRAARDTFAKVLARHPHQADAEQALQLLKLASPAPGTSG